MERGEHRLDVRALDAGHNRQVPPTTFTWTIGLAGLTNAWDVAYDKLHGRMYVTGGSSGNVYIIDVNTNEEIAGSPINIPGSGFLNRIAYDPAPGRERMYVTDLSTYNVYVIDTNTNPPHVLGAPIDLGSHSNGIAYNSDNQMMYVTALDRTVKVIDTASNEVVQSVSLASSEVLR